MYYTKSCMQIHVSITRVRVRSRSGPGSGGGSHFLVSGESLVPEGSQVNEVDEDWWRDESYCKQHAKFLTLIVIHPHFFLLKFIVY